jgi:hypothetical protein
VATLGDRVRDGIAWAIIVYALILVLAALDLEPPGPVNVCRPPRCVVVTLA